MPSISDLIKRSGVSPTYKTRVFFDLPENTVGEGPWAVQRRGAEITAAPGTVGVELLPSGGWAMIPIQANTSQIHEQVDPTGSVLSLADWHTAPGVTTRNRWTPPNNLRDALTGASPNLNPSSGDAFHVSGIGAGLSWIVSLIDDIAALGQPETSAFTGVMMDRHGVTKAPLPPNTGLNVRIQIPATQQHFPGAVANIFMGAPGSIHQQSGLGAYVVSLHGDGTSVLHTSANGLSTVDWFPVHVHRYAPQGSVAGSSHAIRLQPHVGPNSRNFTIITGSNDRANVAGSVAGLFNQPISPNQSNYNLAASDAPRVAQASMASGLSDPHAAPDVSGWGNVRYDIRRDIRPHIQIAVLTYPDSALLLDAPFQVPNTASERTPLDLYWESTIPTTAPGVTAPHVEGHLFRYDTGAELTLLASGTNFRQYAFVPGVYNYRVGFTYHSSGDHLQSPIVWDLKVTKDGVILTSTPGQFEGKILRSMSVTTADQDPTHDSASFTLEDAAHAMKRLYCRGDFRTQVRLQYDASDPSLYSVLADGYTRRPRGNRKGTNIGNGYGKSGPPRLFPSAEWYSIDCKMVGMWERLHEAVSSFRLNLVQPQDIVSTPPRDSIPQRVTDILRAGLGWCGFLPDQIDIPDLPMRFWAPTFPGGGGSEGLMLEPLTVIGDWLVKIAHDYLQYYLVWDGNAGQNGVWRLLPPTVPDQNGNYQNLCSFVSASPPNKAPILPGSFPPKTTFIRKGTYRPETKPPEANFVLVAGISKPNADGTGGGEVLLNYCYNQVSFNFKTDGFGNPIDTADPDHPDFLGRFAPIYFVDPGLQSREAVAFTCRRIFDVTCHAIQTVSFQAPLVLVTDPNDTKQVRPRPLRFYDPVMVKGIQCLMRNVNIDYRKDHLAFATYEAQAATPLSTNDPNLGRD
jgi:hypothetical protein